MPRKAPKEVIEHRVTLGNFERDLLVKQLADSKENKLYVAGINQVGQIAGSGVLLWAAAAYFGYNLIDEFTSSVFGEGGFVDRSSTGLSDMWLSLFGGMTSKEANWYARNNALLNQRVLELNAREKAKEEQIRTITMGLRNGTLTFTEAKLMLDEIGEIPSQETIEERQAIVDARAKLNSIKAEMDEGSLSNLIDGWPTSTKPSAIAGLINAI